MAQAGGGGTGATSLDGVDNHDFPSPTALELTHERVLATVTQPELREAVARLGTARGCRGARLAADFADGDSGSPGESASRANIYLSGMPAPQLQVAYPKPGGGEDKVDFTWDAKHHVRRRAVLIDAGLRPDR